MDMMSQTSGDVAVPVLPDFEATTAQSYYWKRNAALPGDPCLNIAARWRVDGPVSPALMERAWQAIVDRHEILRTIFVEDGDRLVQRVLPHARFRIRHVDLRNTPEQEMDVLCERLGREEAATPFDVSAPPLLRITLLQQADDKAHMLLTTHHLAGDCWSNLTLVKEFGEICEAIAAGQRPRLPDLSLHFGDYAAWRNAWLAAGGAAAAQKYWATRLHGLSNFTVPTDRLPPAHPTRRGDIFGMMIPPGVAEAAMAAAKGRGATFFSFGLATLTALLHRWTGQNDILVTTQIAGRDELELETVIGPFINTLALRGRCTPETRFSDLLEDTLVTVGEALENGSLPFEMLLDNAEPASDGRRGPLNGVNFQVLNSAFLKDSKAGSVALRGFPSLSPGAKRDLDVYLVERAMGWRAQCEYDPDLFDRATVEWFVRAFVDLLAAAGADPSLPLAELPLNVPVHPHAPTQHASDSAAAQEQANVVNREASAVRPSPTAVSADRLVELWSDVLNRPDIALSANFFELGGDSMRAARLLARIHDAFGRRLSLAQFFQKPTLAATAERLGIDPEAVRTLPARAVAAGTAAFDPDGEDWRVMEVSARGSKTPIIGINSVGTLFALAREFGHDRHIFGVRLFEPGKPHGIAGKSFEEIAAEYIEVIRSVEPKGPYILFGLCVHGVLGLEIARQLRDAGEHIEVVGFKNAWHPGYSKRMNFIERQLVRLNNVSWNFARVLRREKSFAAFLGNYRLIQSSGVLQLAGRLGLIDKVPSRTGSETDDEFLLALMNARDSYQPRPYDGTVVQFVSSDAPNWPGFDKTLGWKGVLTGPLFLRSVPQPDPTSPDDDGVADMIEQFRLALHAAGESRPGSS